MLLTLNDDVRVILIKLADRLHNMRTLQYMKPTGQLKISSETQYLYAPLAHRLGLHKIKTELEDLSLAYTEPQVFVEINAKLKKIQREDKYYVQRFMGAIRANLKDEGLDFTILRRYKSIYSIYNKMRRQSIPFEEVYDLFAIRVILKTKDQRTEKAECWRVFTRLTELYTANPERVRDWLTIPRSNGYEALHVTVMGPRGRWIEVQIRSERMDRIAERGIAAHWRYKEGGVQHDDGFVKWLARVRDLLENPSMNAVEVVKEVQADLISDEVFVFTPKGDLIQLPNGSTALDFAYEIHTKIGHGCIGAKVNNKVVPFSYQVQNGDQVEIISSSKSQPKSDWLQYVKTSKARNRIREALRKQRRVTAEKGQKIFEWKMKNYELSNQLVTRELLIFFEVPNEQEFFYLLGMHKLDMQKLQEFIQLKKEGRKIESRETLEKNRQATRENFEAQLQESKGVNSDMLLIGEDMDISDYTLGECCTPVPGDEIIGIVHPSDGVVIHRQNCPNAIHMMSNWGKNIIKTKWTETQRVTFLAGVKIIGSDRQGMMNSLIMIISNSMKLNIRSITIDSNDGMFEGVFKVFIRNTHQLNNLSNRLREVDGVLEVIRVEET